MMRNTKKAFTLVELIVVITILAILGTIAFISLQGYSGEAKNSKVTADLRNIASAIETASTRNSIVLFDVVSGTRVQNQVAWTFGNVNSNTGATLTLWTNYRVGNVNFSAIGQNGEDFKDPNSTNAASNYIFAVVTIPTFKSYQLAWQIVENDVKKARINGTYYRDPAGSDVVWLISPATATGALIDGGEIGIGNDNDLYNSAP